MDAEFLKEIEGWRNALARNIALRNPKLTAHDLNFAVQMTIDRIIFLRMCEDRGIEHYGQLQALCGGQRIYPRMLEIYRKADERYNSGLFHFEQEKDQSSQPDELTPTLTIDDKTLKDILFNLYYPDSPYEFRILPPEILGNVYEQFLGKVIRLTTGHQAKIEEKPEVRKAGGVYYTPSYIVDYIVKNTVGKLLEEKTPGQVAKLRILDPACGSGSFLLGAYQYLLDWHLKAYIAEREKTGKILTIPPETGKRRRKSDAPVMYQGQGSDWRAEAKPSGGDWMLTTVEKKRILLNNIYGVDIDPQAVEVTKLSLLLKVLENENQDTLRSQLTLWHERALPDLSGNIKCGNSLIGPDFYQNRQMDMFDEEDKYRINAFDWNDDRQGFGQIMKSGGFDAAIGNPPYIRIQTMKEWAPVEVELYKKLYQSAAAGNYDIYVVFVEKALSLLNWKGRMGFILPHKFFNAQYGEALRGVIADGQHLVHVVHFGDQQVFSGATTYTCLLFLDKASAFECRFMKVSDLRAWRETVSATDLSAIASATADNRGPGSATPATEEGLIPAKTITAAEWNFVIGKGAGLFDRLAKMSVKLGDVTSRIYQGPITSADTVFLFKDFKQGKKGTTEIVSAELGQTVLIESAILKRVIRSGSIGRYRATPNALVLFPYEVKDCEARLYTPKEMQDRFPMAWEYLNRNRDLLAGREKGKFKNAQWYRFGRTQNLGMWERPKLMIPYMITNLAAYLDREDDFYFINVTTGGYGITSDEKAGSLEYLCALLNSHLLDFYLKRVTTTFHGNYFAANKQFIELLPIQPIDFADAKDKARHDKIVRLANDMLDLHKRLQAAKTPNEKTRLERQISATDKQIDALVYELYDLTAEEIKIVEESLKT